MKLDLTRTAVTKTATIKHDRIGEITLQIGPFEVEQRLACDFARYQAEQEGRTGPSALGAWDAEYLRQRLVGWSGVFDAKTGEPVPWSWDHFRAACRQEPIIADLVMTECQRADQIDQQADKDQEGNSELPPAEHSSDVAAVAAQSPQPSPSGALSDGASG